MATQPVSFDAPLQQATTVSVPAGVTFDQPLAKSMSITVSGQPSAPSQTPQTTDTASQAQQPAQPFVPTATLSATPKPANTAEAIEQWASDLHSDLMHGTDHTKVGALLKLLGAPGLEHGVSPETAEFMGSPLLGPTRVVKGAAELAQSGKRWQGTKDVVGGALDASTIPGAFVAPEAGNLVGQGVDAAATQAARAAKAVSRAATKPFDTHTAQAPLQQGVRDVLSTVAKEAGVTPAPSASIRDVAGQVADAVLERSKTAYQTLDKATGGRFQRFDDALRNINRKLRETAGLDDENEAALLQRKAEVEQSQHDVFDQAKTAGVDPKLVDNARDDWKKAQSLYDLDRQLKLSASGMRPEMALPGSTREILDPRKAFDRLNKLYNSGRLQQAVGPTQAEQIIQHADSAFLHQAKILARQKALKAGASAAGLGGAGAAGYETVKALGGSQ